MRTRKSYEHMVSPLADSPVPETERPSWTGTRLKDPVNHEVVIEYLNTHPGTRLNNLRFAEEHYFYDKSRAWQATATVCAPFDVE